MKAGTETMKTHRTSDPTRSSPGPVLMLTRGDTATKRGTMFGKGRLARASLAAALLTLGACAPSFGPGVGITLSPGGDLSVASSACSPLSAEPLQAGAPRAAAAARVFSVRSLISSIHSRYALGLRTPHMRLEESKRIVAGGC